MKNPIALTLIGAALLGAAPLSPAAAAEDKTTAKEVRQEMADTADSIKHYTIEQRDEAAKKAKAGLAALDDKIKALEARIDRDWDKMDKAARAKARATLDALHQQRIAAAEWYGALKNSTAEAWEDMKRGFSDAYQSLLHASEKADRENRKR